jgi:hypothetical protein
MHANHRRHRVTLAKSALGAAVAWGALTAGQAQAFVVNVGGVNYDVTTFGPDSYNNNISKFALPANGGVMPWWNDQTLANTFAVALGTSLGTPNPNGSGPYFAYASPNIVSSQYRDANSGGGRNDLKSDTSITWAQAAPMSAPVPGPLPAFGAAAAFGFSRKLRGRINASKGDSSRAATL